MTAALRSVLALLLLVTVSPVLSCSDGHAGHSHPHRSPATIATPTRPLEWGDINIIHTTDSHGWLMGHQKDSAPEPNYSGDFGAFASFVQHMKAEAKNRGVDLLLVDSGDLHDGTGLSDGFPPGGVDGHESNKIFAELPYDLLAIGNHELYLYDVALDVHQNFAPKFKGRYLSSNVNITLLDKHNNNVSVPVGERFAKFKTERGLSVTSIGVLFEFTDNSMNTTVQPVDQMVKEPWFQDAIADAPDIFVLAGHMPVSRDKWPVVHDAIRAVHPTTPIIMLGGHTHIRDCVQFDGRSMALESGRYMETVGWMSVKLDHNKDSKENLTFSRRYLDPNPVTYEYHTGLKDSRFDTPQGTQISASIQRLAEQFNLTQQFGTAPQDYLLNRVPYPSNQSLLSLYMDQVLPYVLAVNNSNASTPNVILADSGGMRFDIYSGSFTKNDQITASPFTDGFRLLEGISFAVASQVLDHLNSPSVPSSKRQLDEEAVQELYNKGDVSVRFARWLQDQWERSAPEKRELSNLTLGYVTHDSCPGIGDDTPHTPIPFFSDPSFVSSPLPSVDNDTTIGVVFLDFIQSDVIQIVNALGSNVTAADVKVYTHLLTNEVLGLYAQANWN